MRTCDVCGREHKGRGLWCSHCNGHNRSEVSCQPGRKQLSTRLAGAMEYTEEMERNRVDGWPYEDADRNELNGGERESD